MKQFLDYLFYIGVVSKQTINNFLSIIEEKSNQNKEEIINTNNLIHAILFDFLKSLNTEDLSNLAENIYTRYKKNQKVTFSKFLLKVLDIRKKQKLRIINIYFKKWKKCVTKHKTVHSNKYLLTDTSAKVDNKEKRSNTSQKNNDKPLCPPNNLTNFYKRLMFYDTKKNNRTLRNLMINEQEFKTNCPFSPNLNLTTKKNNELKQKIRNNESTKKKEILSIEKVKKTVDKERINRLYTDYQTRIINNSNLKKNIDAENGITFSPYVNHKSQYYKNVKDDFFKRNKTSLENKKEFVEGFNYFRDLQMKGVDITKKNNK